MAVAESIHAPMRLSNGHRHEVLDLSEIRGRTVSAFSGIGNPMAFRRTLEKLGCRIGAFEVFPDHCRYGESEINRLQQWAKQQPADGLVITTQKDLVKIPLAQLGERPLWGLHIALQLTAGKEAFDRKLERVLHERFDHFATDNGSPCGVPDARCQRRAG